MAGETVVSERGGRKRKHSGCRSVSSVNDYASSGSGSEKDSVSNAIPPCTSTWDVCCLESLSISYASAPCTLSELLGKTDMLPQLDTELQNLLTKLKNCFDFDFEINELKRMRADRFVRDVVRASLEGTKMSILAEYASENSHKASIKPVLDFLEDTVCMIMEVRDRAATDGVYRQFFSSFISMCQLSPKSGDSYKCKTTIKGTDVESTAHLRIKCVEEDSILLVQNSNNSAAVVSIYEAKKFCKSDEPLPEHGNTGASPHVVQENPNICQWLDKDVLGEHGGQLLLEWQSCCINNRYMPGMIIVGSKILFTLLDLSDEHNEKLLSNEELDNEDSATIYYTEAYDILKKSDRDILMETFLRLSMYRTAFL